MIQNNRHGWGTFQLGNFTGRISYIEDVPVDLLQAFIDWREKGSGCAWIDEEGTEFTFVLTPYSMFVISERNNTELFNLSEFKFEEIEKELIDDACVKVCKALGDYLTMPFNKVMSLNNVRKK